MHVKKRNLDIVVCDDNLHTRRLVADVLMANGFERVHFAQHGAELLKLTAEYQPRIVITSSRVPELSGLEFTRAIRAGYQNVNRATSVIVMTDTPTQKFIDAARQSGVDEMLVRPFNAQALMVRVQAVLLRPRRFVESVNYVGPCRRRRMLEEYDGPMRRFTDDIENDNKQPWEAESNRELVRNCVTRISELSAHLSAGDRKKLREIYVATRDTEQLADDMRDQALGDAARSLGRYITAIGGSGKIAQDVLTTHIHAMQQLITLGSSEAAERDEVVAGLVKVVDKRLGRKPQAA